MYPFAAGWPHPLAGQFLYRQKKDSFSNMDSWPIVGLANRPSNGSMVSLTITLLGQPFINGCGDCMPICAPNSRADINAD